VDREAISWMATTGAIGGGDIRDLMIESVERRYGLVNRLPQPIEWLSDNGSAYTARETRALARDIGLVPGTTPVQSPQSNGMAEAFVKTFKRDYAQVNPRPYAAAVVRQLPPAQGAWLPLAARVQKRGGGGRRRNRGRRSAPTAWMHNVHGRDRVKPVSRA
jgi:transposase InsO family protein